MFLCVKILDEKVNIESNRKAAEFFKKNAF